MSKERKRMKEELTIKRGEELFSQGNIEEAEALFLTLLGKEKQNATILNNLGTVCFTSGRQEEAERYFLHALEVNSSHRDALLNLSSLYQGAERWDEAAVQLEHLLETEKQDVEILNQLAVVYLEEGDQAKAISTLKRSLVAHPEQPDIERILNNLERSVAQPHAGAPPAANAVPGMISPAEQTFLFECARNIALKDNDIIVEFGPYFGRSTYYLAEGLEQNPQRKPTNVVHTYDAFECDQAGPFAQRVMADADKAKVSHLLDMGKGRLGFRRIAEFYLKKHLDKQVIVRQAELNDSWPPKPLRGSIAVLHIDSPKYYEEFKIIMFRFFPHLKQGSTIIFQDYFYHWSASLITAVQMLMEAGIVEARCTRASSLIVEVMKTPTVQMLYNVDQACLSQDHAAVIDRAMKTVIGLCHDKAAREIHFPFLLLAKIQCLWAAGRQAEASRVFGDMLVSIHPLVLKGFIELLSRGFDNRGHYKKDHPPNIAETRSPANVDKRNNILHIMISATFMPPFIEFVDKHFGRNNHRYVFVDKERYEYGLTPEHGVEFIQTIDGVFITLLDYMKKADKIILHGLWRTEIDILLYFNQDLLKKCYWCMWGGDYYFPERRTVIRKQIIGNMGHAVNNTIGDYELVQKWYGTKAQHHKCFGYLSNTFKDYSYLKSGDENNNGKRILLVGNSADPTNNHFEIFEKIRPFKDDDTIEVICPLSYGDNAYAKKVVSAGNSIFGDRFRPLVEFMPLEEYIKKLLKVDVAIFAHRRQQAMGTIRTLIGLGKKVYMRDDITSWFSLKEIDVQIYSFNAANIDFDFPERFKDENIRKMQENYSYERLISDWEKIFLN